MVLVIYTLKKYGPLEIDQGLVFATNSDLLTPISLQRTVLER